MPNRDRITISIDKSALEWIDSKIEAGVFFNRSHGIEFCLKKEMSKN